MFESLDFAPFDCIESAVDFRKELSKERWKNGFVCPRCNCSKGYALQTRDLIECSNCKKQTSSTAGTVFQGVRRLVEFCGALKDFCMGNHNSAAQYARETGIDPGTAWIHLQKIRAVVAGQRLETASVDVPCTLFKPALTKQSSEDELLLASTKSNAQEIVSVTILNSASAPAAKLPAAMIHSAMAFMLSVFRGVSRKYSQLYLSEFNWIVENRKLDFRDALSMCLRGRPMIRDEIAEFKSPFLLRIVDKDVSETRSPPIFTSMRF